MITDRAPLAGQRAVSENRHVTAIVLTFNSANSIGIVLDALGGVARRIVVVDSNSSDHTREVVESAGAEFVQHPFENYSKQRRWAEAHAEIPQGDWVLHLDSDEVITDELAKSIARATTEADSSVAGFLIQRLSFFWGRPIRHGHMNPNWHLRLYRSGKGFCEDRLYDQHFVARGETRKLQGLLLDMQLVSLESWTSSHNRWSTAEAQEAALCDGPGSGERLQGRLMGDRRQRKRWLKEKIWYRTPPLARSFAFFLYSYVFKLGFLDGKAGLVYHVLHAFWFRFLIDAKVMEANEFQGFLGKPPSAAWLANHGVNLGKEVRAPARPRL